MIEVTGNEPFDEQAEFYASLKINLEKNHNFPEDYLYKFIIVNNQEKLTEIYKVFDGTKILFLPEKAVTENTSALPYNVSYWMRNM